VLWPDSVNIRQLASAVPCCNIALPREETLKFLILLVFLSAPSLMLCAQREECPQFSGAVKERMEKEARWLVSDSLQEQVALKSSAFGRLIAIERCHILQSNLLSEQVTEEQGPFFVADHVPIKSRIGRYEGTWMMVVAPVEATGRMPDANVLEITDHKWNLLHRDKGGPTRPGFNRLTVAKSRLHSSAFPEGI
jgi:hypothetical protein